MPQQNGDTLDNVAKGEHVESLGEGAEEEVQAEGTPILLVFGVVVALTPCLSQLPRQTARLTAIATRHPEVLIR